MEAVSNAEDEEAVSAAGECWKASAYTKPPSVAARQIGLPARSSHCTTCRSMLVLRRREGDAAEVSRSNTGRVWHDDSVVTCDRVAVLFLRCSPHTSPAGEENSRTPGEACDQAKEIHTRCCCCCEDPSPESIAAAARLPAAPSALPECRTCTHEPSVAFHTRTVRSLLADANSGRASVSMGCVFLPAAFLRVASASVDASPLYGSSAAGDISDSSDDAEEDDENEEESNDDDGDTTVVTDGGDGGTDPAPPSTVR